MQNGELPGVVLGVLLNLLPLAILIVAFLAVLLGCNACRTPQGCLVHKSETER